jgi:DNA-binding GntR family transcriptional regulator
MQRLKQLKRDRASDLVFLALRENILKQVFQPGERLNPEEIAGGLGVSLTPVKDAFTRLAAQGLVEIKPRSGTFVADLVAEDVAETFEIRGALEGLAAERLVERITDAEIIEFQRLVSQMEELIRSDEDRSAHERLNVDFHERIVALAGNRKLLQLYTGLNAHITIARVHYRGLWQERLQSEREEHREILEARDAAALATALRRHIRRASESLVTDLQSRGARPVSAGDR